MYCQHKDGLANVLSTFAYLDPTQTDTFHLKMHLFGFVFLFTNTVKRYVQVLRIVLSFEIHRNILWCKQEAVTMKKRSVYFRILPEIYR